MTNSEPLFGVTRSAKGNSWRLREVDERHLLAIVQRHSMPEILARVVLGRGVEMERIEHFLSPTLRDLLPDPLHLRDMEVAANRLVKAIVAKEKVAIFGDYDVDGATSTALLVRYLRHFGLDPLVHIPDRMKEGYGPNAPALLGLQAKGAKLVITVDCGAASHEPLRAAHEAGLELIVIDHHIGDVNLPKAVAVVNPNRFDESSPHRHMAAVGVAFLLVVATNKVLREQGVQNIPNPIGWLDIVALGTVCDVVSLTGVNRAFVSQGLKVLAGRTNVGLAALADVGRMDETPSAYHLGFVLGPRINAGGRVGQSDLGVRLLTCDDYGEAMAIAQQLDHFNNERKTLETLALEEAMAQAEKRAGDEAVLLVEGNWHAGVIGIVAGRLKDKFNKPTAVIAWEGDVGKASARSVPGVDLGAAIVAARTSGLLVAGGGHAMAAGFTVEKSKLDALRQFLCGRLADGVARYGETRAMMIDGVLSPAAATVELVKRLGEAEPFGMGNATPKFAFANLHLVKVDVVGDGHLRCLFTDGGVGGKASGARLQGIAFRAVGTPMEEMLTNRHRTLFHVVGQLRLNSWQDSERVDLHIEDIAVAG